MKVVEKLSAIEPFSTGALLATLFLFIVIWIALPQEFFASDPWAYSVAANDISKHLNFGSIDLFNLRLGIIGPVAILYKLFGVNIVTTNLWPFCTTLLLIVVIWSALRDTQGKLIALGLSVLSVPVWEATLNLYGDMIAAAFMAASVLLLIGRERVTSRRLPWIGILGVLALFVAFLAKESSYWVAPLWLFALCEDVSSRKDHMRLKRFWLPGISVSIGLALSYLVLCWVVWGDPLARLKGVEMLTHEHLWGWDHATGWELLKRLTFGPAQFLSSYYGPLFFLAVMGALMCPRETRYWVYYLALCTAFYWFGSASLSSYQPLPYVGRMTWPLLPAMLILAAQFVANVEFKGRSTLERRSPVWLVALMMLFPFVAFANVQTRDPLSDTRAMAFLKREVVAHPEARYLLVTSDKRSAKSLKFYFGYEYPKNLNVVAAGDTNIQFRIDEYVYVYINNYRSSFLASLYGEKNYPIWDGRLESIKLSRRFQSAPVALYKVSDASDLDKLENALDSLSKN